jgi:hypothetical protein
MFVATLAASAARAADVSRSPKGPAADDDVSRRTEEDAAKHRIDRTWLYTDDARVAAPWTLLAGANLSYTSVGNSPSRIVAPVPGCTAPCTPYNSLAANTATPGGVLGVSGELGLLPRLSAMAVTQVGIGGSESVPSPTLGALVGLRLQVLPAAWRTMHLTLAGGYLREAWQGPRYGEDGQPLSPGSPKGDDGAWLRASFSADFGRVRVATTLHGEHVLSAGRDPVDLMVQAGAAYRVLGAFRVGVEYVGQDLEESFSSGAEGGARQFVGPVVSMQLNEERFTLVAGPSVGLTSRSPDLLGRVAAAYSF